RVGAEHDPPFGLVAEAGVPGLVVHLADVCAGDAEAVAHAVVAREVRRRLGRRDEVVAGEPVLDRPRQRRLPHLRAELAAELDRPLRKLLHARLDPLGVVQLAGPAAPNAPAGLAPG